MAHSSDPRPPLAAARPLPYTADGLHDWLTSNWSPKATAYAYSGLSHDEQPRAVRYSSSYGQAAITAIAIARQRSNGDLRGEMSDQVADAWFAALRELNTFDDVRSGKTGLSPVTEDGIALRGAADRAAAKEVALPEDVHRGGQDLH